MIAALAMSLSSLSVVFNALRLSLHGPRNLRTLLHLSPAGGAQ
jgi:hypothetical protein